MKAKFLIALFVLVISLVFSVPVVGAGPPALVVVPETSLAVNQIAPMTPDDSRLIALGKEDILFAEAKPMKEPLAAATPTASLLIKESTTKSPRAYSDFYAAVSLVNTVLHGQLQRAILKLPTLSSLVQKSGSSVVTTPYTAPMDLRV